jgi:hypothetical protein
VDHFDLSQTSAGHKPSFDLDFGPGRGCNNSFDVDGIPPIRELVGMLVTGRNSGDKIPAEHNEIAGPSDIALWRYAVRLGYDDFLCY